MPYEGLRYCPSLRLWELVRLCLVQVFSCLQVAPAEVGGISFSVLALAVGVDVAFSSVPAPVSSNVPAPAQPIFPAP